MPKLLHKLPKYRRHSTRNSGFVVISGQRVYLPGDFGSEESKSAYRRLCAEWIVQDRPSTPAPPMAELTIVELMVQFWRHAQRHYVKNGQPTDEQSGIRLALRPLRELYGTTPAAAFGPLKLKAVREQMVAQGLARTTINQNIGRIRRMFRWGASEELVPASVYQSLSTVQGLQRGRTEAREPDPVLPVEDDRIDAALPFMPPIVADMARLQRLCGARPGEIVIVRPCDVKRDGKVWKYSPESHKNEHRGKKRVIYLGPQAQEILRPYLDRRADAYCFSPAEAEAERRQAAHEARKTPLTCGNAPGTNKRRAPRKVPGDHYTPDSYRRAISRACELASQMPLRLRSIPHDAPDAEQRRKEAADWRRQHAWAPNRLRHTAATKIREQFGLEAASATLGHSQFDTTLIYAERPERVALEVAEKVG
ncbi:MAG: site-specific integrase [Pirellulales bacterium]